MFFSFIASLVSSQKLGQREGAMATRWNQVVLPMGREQDRVDARADRTRRELECRPIGIVTVHREPCAIEVSNRRLEDNEVHSSGGPGTEVISGRISAVVERIVHRIEQEEQCIRLLSLFFRREYEERFD